MSQFRILEPSQSLAFHIVRLKILAPTKLTQDSKLA
jgi:hypothetical protein